LFQSYINLPWAPKLVYGILCDSVPVFGSTKRGYIVLMGIIQVVTLMICALFGNLSAGMLTLLLTIYSMGGAFMEVVC
jgi:hypothetical protein